MTSTEENTDYKLLRERVERKFGSKITYSRDCSVLSSAIQEATGAQVSETTLKRFWNFVNATIQPSKYTLNSLSQYIGFRDYADFMSQRSEILSSEAEIELWTTLQESGQAISHYSFENVKSRFYSGYEKAIRRSFPRHFMDGFIDSGKRVAMLVAPIGWGKSATVAQIVDEYFLSEDGRCSGDVLWYLDIESMYHTIRSRKAVDDFYFSAMGDGDKTADFLSIFEDYPNAVKGHVYVIVDCLITPRHIDNFVRMLQRYKNCDYMRFIITMRPQSWLDLSKQLPFDMRQYFWNINWEPQDTQYSNIPAWSTRERLTLLMNCGQFNALTYSLIYKTSTRSIFRAPRYLDMFLQMSQEGRLNEVRLMEDIVVNLFGQYTEGKRTRKFLSYFLCVTQYGVKPNWEIDADNSAIVDEYQDICNNLISSGFICIKPLTPRYLDRKYEVMFKCDGLYDFLIANYWLKEDGLNVGLLDRMAVHYSNDEMLKRRLFSWMIKYAFREGNVEVLNSMFEIIDRSFEDEDSKVWLKFRFCDNFRYNVKLQDKLFQKDEDLIFYVTKFIDLDYLDSFAGDVFSRLLARESCRPYFKSAYSMQMYCAFLHCDKARCAEIYRKMLELGKQGDDSQHYYIALFTTQVMNDFLQHGGTTESEMEYIVSNSSSYFKNPEVYKGCFLNIGFMLLDALMLTRQYKALLRLCMEAFTAGIGVIGTARYMIIQLMYAVALHNTGDQTKAHKLLLEINIQVLMRNIPPNMFLYWAYHFTVIFKKLGFGDRDDVKVFNEMLSGFFNYEFYR